MTAGTTVCLHTPMDFQISPNLRKYAQSVTSPPLWTRACEPVRSESSPMHHPHCQECPAHLSERPAKLLRKPSTLSAVRMATGSTYTRGLCVVLNILLGIFGVILLLFGIANSVKVEPVEDGSQSVNLSLGFGLATVLISVLGVYGAYREDILALIVYSMLMAVEFLVLMVLAIIVTLTQSQKEAIEQDFDKMIPLYEASEASQRDLNKLQLENRCCGLKDYTDWGGQIPHSCFCPPEYPDRQVHCVTVKLLSNVEGIRSPHTSTQLPQHADLYVYQMTCGPILTEQRANTLKILLGIFFTLATIKVAAVIVALLLCYKIHTKSAVTGASHDNDTRTKYELHPDKMP